MVDCNLNPPPLLRLPPWTHDCTILRWHATPQSKASVIGEIINAQIINASMEGMLGGLGSLEEQECVIM